MHTCPCAYLPTPCERVSTVRCAHGTCAATLRRMSWFARQRIWRLPINIVEYVHSMLCANGWREVAERKAANKLEHDAAVAARWSAMQPSQKRQRVDGAKAVEEGDTEFCSCSE
jgi:hypothetical protein